MDVIRQDSVHKRNKLEGERSWSSNHQKGKLEDYSMCNFPDDILIAILSKLSLVDLIRCRVVCKNWKLLIEDIRPGDKFPWLMLYDWGMSDDRRIRSVCKLFVPAHQKLYTIENGYKGEEWRNFAGAEDCYSRDGWVLFRRHQGQYPDSTVFLFAFSPFSNKTVKLPPFEMGNIRSSYEKRTRPGFGFSLRKAAFSSSPSSSDCIFFALTSWTFEDESAISTYRKGDPAWKTFRIDDTIYGVFHDATYSDGILYCVFSYGTLGTFNVAKQQWSCLIRNGTPLDKGFLGVKDKHRLVMDNGKLLSLVHMNAVNWPRDHGWEIWRLDSSKKKWIVQASLEEKAAFFDGTSFLIPAVGEASELVDTVIIPNWKELIPFEGGIYSFKVGGRIWGKALKCYDKAPKGLGRTYIQPCDLISLQK